MGQSARLLVTDLGALELLEPSVDLEGLSQLRCALISKVVGGETATIERGPSQGGVICLWLLTKFGPKFGFNVATWLEEVEIRKYMVLWLPDLMDALKLDQHRVL